MARSLIFQLVTKSYEKARDLGREIQATVKKSTDLAKDTRKEIVAAAREGVATAKLLSRAAGKEAPRLAALQGRADALTGAAEDQTALRSLATAAARTRGLVGAAEGLAGGGLGSLAGALTFAAGPAGALAGITAGLLQQLKSYVDTQFDKKLEDRDRLIRLELEDGLRTFEQRLKSEPIFAQEQAERAAQDYGSYQKALAQSGLAPSAEYLEGE